MYHEFPSDYAVCLLNPPKMANSAKNIEIGRILITVQAICFALVHASLPSGFVATGGQSIAASTSEYIRIPMIRPTATPMNPMMYDISIMCNSNSQNLIYKTKFVKDVFVFLAITFPYIPTSKLGISAISQRLCLDCDPTTLAESGRRVIRACLHPVRITNCLLSKIIAILMVKLEGKNLMN